MKKRVPAGHPQSAFTSMAIYFYVVHYRYAKNGEEIRYIEKKEREK
jgi:hypothetical protein